MQTITADEFKKKYGDNALTAFHSPQTSDTTSPGILSRIANDAVNNYQTAKNTLDTAKSDPSGNMGSDFTALTSAVASNAKTIPDTVAEAIKSLPGGETVLNSLGDIIGQAFHAATNKLAQTDLIKGAAGNDVVGPGGIHNYVPNQTTAPLENVLKNVSNIGDTASSLATLDAVPSVASFTRKVADVSKAGVSTAVDTVKSGISKVPNSTFLNNISRPEVASSIMDKVARVKPTDYTEFKDMSGGKSIGQYLTETGNTNAPDAIVANEAQKFVQSMKEVDSTLEQIPGTFKDESIKQALKGLQERSISTSAGKIKPTWNSELNGYIKAYNQGGLDMSQINELKRLYEREVRLSYKKDITAGTALKKATNVDSALRDWQFKTAADNGFTNIADMNKQTQMSRFIIDKLGDSLVGKSGLNNVSLTDWVMLSGGDPTAVGGFLTKKFFSSKSVQAKIAEIINNKDVNPYISADYAKKAQLALPAPRDNYRSAIDSGAPIALPKLSQSTLDALELANPNIKTNINTYLKNGRIPVTADKVDAINQIFKRSGETIRIKNNGNIYYIPDSQLPVIK